MNPISTRLTRKIVFVLLTHFILTTHFVIAQSSSGPFSGTVFSNDNIIGVYTVGTPGNAAASDNNRASASAIIGLLSGNTNYLKASGFGFAIPLGSTITGIVVEVEKSASNISILSTVTDHSVRLIKGGTIVGSDYNTSVEWPSTEAYYSYGSSSDLWGTTWSAAEINSANFGIAFSASLDGIIALLPSARIDHIRVTVYFNISVLPIHIVNFSSTALNEHSAKLQWTTANNDEAALFSVQRSSNRSDWVTLHEKQGEISTTDKTYYYTDNDCRDNTAFYRLQVSHTSGRVSYSQVTQVNFSGLTLNVYPNPATDHIFVQHNGNIGKIDCFSIDGKKWPLNYTNTGNDLIRIGISHLSRGPYIIEVNGNKKLLIKN